MKKIISYIDWPIIRAISGFFQENKGENVCLDIGSRYIKGVYSSQGNVRDFFLEKNSGNPLAQAATWLAGKDLIDQKVKIAIKGQDALVRYIPFPKMDAGNLREVFEYEVSKFIPFKREEIYFDVSLLDEDYSAEEFLVLMASSKKEVVDDLAARCVENNIKVEQITLSNVALLNLFLQKSDQEKNIALIDIGYSSSSLNLIKKGVPCLSREIKVSGRTFFQKMGKTSPEDIDRAEEMIKTMDFLGTAPVASECHKAVEEVLLELSDEIKNSLDYFEVNWGQPVQSLCLSGGFARLKGAAVFLGGVLGIDTKVWDPFQGQDSGRGKDSGQVKELLAVALGLSV